MGGLTATTTDTTVGYAGSSNSLVGLNTNHSHSQTNNLTFSLADYVKSFFVFRSRPGGEPQIPSDLNTLQRSTCCRKHRPGGEITREKRPGGDRGAPPGDPHRLELTAWGKSYYRILSSLAHVSRPCVNCLCGCVTLIS